MGYNRQEIESLSTPSEPGLGTEDHPRHERH
jgi:hypothetical protein